MPFTFEFDLNLLSNSHSNVSESAKNQQESTQRVGTAVPSSSKSRDASAHVFARELITLNNRKPTKFFTPKEIPTICPACPNPYETPDWSKPKSPVEVPCAVLLVFWPRERTFTYSVKHSGYDDVIARARVCAQADDADMALQYLETMLICHRQLASTPSRTQFAHMLDTCAMIGLRAASTIREIVDWWLHLDAESQGERDSKSDTQQHFVVADALVNVFKSIGALEVEDILLHMICYLEIDRQSARIVCDPFIVGAAPQVTNWFFESIESVMYTEWTTRSELTTFWADLVTYIIREPRLYTYAESVASKLQELEDVHNVIYSLFDAQKYLKSACSSQKDACNGGLRAPIQVFRAFVSAVFEGSLHSSFLEHGGYCKSYMRKLYLCVLACQDLALVATLFARVSESDTLLTHLICSAISSKEYEQAMAYLLEELYTNMEKLDTRVFPNMLENVVYESRHGLHQSTDEAHDRRLVSFCVDFTARMLTISPPQSTCFDMLKITQVLCSLPFAPCDVISLEKDNTDEGNLAVISLIKDATDMACEAFVREFDHSCSVSCRCEHCDTTMAVVYAAANALMVLCGFHEQCRIESFGRNIIAAWQELCGEKLCFILFALDSMYISYSSHFMSDEFAKKNRFGDKQPFVRSLNRIYTCECLPWLHHTHLNRHATSCAGHLVQGLSLEKLSQVELSQLQELLVLLVNLKAPKHILDAAAAKTRVMMQSAACISPSSKEALLHAIFNKCFSKQSSALSTHCGDSPSMRALALDYFNILMTYEPPQKRDYSMPTVKLPQHEVIEAFLRSGQRTETFELKDGCDALQLKFAILGLTDPAIQCIISWNAWPKRMHIDKFTDAEVAVLATYEERRKMIEQLCSAFPNLTGSGVQGD